MVGENILHGLYQELLTFIMSLELSVIGVCLQVILLVSSWSSYEGLARDLTFYCYSVNNSGNAWISL